MQAHWVRIYQLSQ